MGPSDDFDNDGMPNDYEDLFGLNKFSNDANGDLDGDGLTNIEEFNLGTIPNNPDTDGDGIPDGQDNGPLQPESSPPQVTIVSPADGATVVEGQTIAFNVDAFDDGILTSVELSTDSGFSRTFTNPPFQDQIIVPIGIDEITFSVTATDGVPNVTTVIATLTVVPDPLTEIIGTVVDLEGNVVDGAQVTVIGLGDSASTDASGNFSIPDVRTVQGDFRLRIDANDQRALTDRFTFSLDGTTNVGRIILNPEGTSAGFEFALAFQRNNSTSALTRFISGDDATDGTVTIPGLGFTQGFSVTPGAVTSVAVPSGAAVTTTDGVQNLGIQVTSDDAPITVYGLNQQLATTDAYAAYPVLEGGARYRVMCYTPRTSAQTAIVAADDGTVLTVTPSVTVGSRTAGIPYQVNLDALEVYQLAGPDLTGTLIDSNKPISVFSGNQCANVPSRSSFCDHLVEQMPPVETWGQTILTIPLATRLNGDTFRILADEDGTIVSIIGIESEVIDLDSGEFAERILQGNNRIVANKPILVAQFSNGTSFDNVTSDPFMMLVPPSEQFLRSYTFATPGSGFSINFVNIVAETVDAVTEQVILNGLPVSAAEFQPIAASDFSVASLPLAIGKHTITSSSPSGIYVYGFANADSYGYPGGLGFAPGSVDTEPSLLVTSEEFTAQALSDWMEIQFAEISEGEGVNDDYDGDGNDNESEFAAGTNPRDAQSKLAIRSLEKRDGAWHVSWNSVPAKLYQIEARESLSDAWKTRVSHVRGANGEITESLIEEDNGLGACFYRIIVQP